MKADVRDAGTRAMDVPQATTEEMDGGTRAPGERYTDAGTKPAVSTGTALVPGPTASELAYGSAPRGAGMIALQRILREADPQEGALALAKRIQALIERYPTERSQILEAADQHRAGLADEIRGLERRTSDAPHLEGGGVKAGDFTIRPTIPFSTSDQYDNHQNKAKAEEDRERERSAVRHGDKEYVAPAFRPAEALDPAQRDAHQKADQAIEQIRGQLGGHPDGGVESPLEIHRKLER